MVSLRGLILLFRRSSPSLLYGSPPPPARLSTQNNLKLMGKLWDDLPTLT